MRNDLIMKPQKFRKKPIIIEAIRWVGTNIEDCAHFMCAKVSEIYKPGDKYSLFIYTKEGTMQARLGDWIIKGVNEEVYPCKADIFEKTYELVE